MTTDGCNRSGLFVDVGMELELIIALAATGLNHACEVILEEPTEANVESLAKGYGRHQCWPWGPTLVPTTAGCNQGRTIDQRKNMVYHG